MLMVTTPSEPILLEPEPKELKYSLSVSLRSLQQLERVDDFPV